MIFTPLHDFWSDEFQSQYSKGLTYTARTPLLHYAVEQWVKEGKVAIIKEKLPAASVRGRGEVK